ARKWRRAHVSGVMTTLSLLLGVMNSLNAQSLTWLGTLGGNLSEARGVSNDGSVVVGFARNASGRERAFRWTPSGGMQNLGTLGGNDSWARGVSADGSVVVGWAYLSFNSAYRAFRWTQSDGMQDLGAFGGALGDAYGVSANGSVVVGWAHNNSGWGRAFRWTAGTGMADLGTLNGLFSEAFGISGNGQVIVGRSRNHLGEMWAFWWTFANRMQVLTPLAVCCGEAKGVSYNGSVIVGRSHSAQTEQWHACLWVLSGNDYSPVDLGTLGGNESEAYACTDNQAAVGWSHNAAGQRRAFRWTPSDGMEDLNVTHAALLTNGSYLEIAYAISPSGRHIVGRGYNAATGRSEGFLLDTQPSCTAHNGDVDGSGCVDDADLLAVLFNFGATGLNPADVNCDSQVDDADLLIVLFNFGSGC
ncbi:MAG: hypothetical protein ACK4ME_10670, partial [Fimbriimonadales bacterium]